MSKSISNKEEFIGVMDRLRKWPERSDHINAYAVVWDEIEDDNVLGNFEDAIYGDEYLKSLQDDIVNAYHQLYSIDFQRCYEGINTFYENFYEDNAKENVLRACSWLKQNGHEQMAEIIEAGYKGREEQKTAADWMNDHMEEIYATYRSLMFMFEEKYLKND